MQNTIPHHIIAIGASAGGMEEINSFFDHTPLDGVAYVIIQHLSSDFKRRMVELLGKHSKLEVLEAEDGSELKSNQVYLIPNDKFMSANQGNFLTLEKYLIFLKSNTEEVEALAKDFLISVTSFFRDKEAFSFIQKKILPIILEKVAPGEELKMWVAGCATGEEAYSLAILVAEQLIGKYKDIIVKIFATDIDSLAMDHAGKGIYHPDIARHVSEERLEKYFTKEGDNFRVKPEIRNMVIFAQHDLVKNPPYCNMNFISCRNLLIYMTPVLQKKIFSMMLFGLKMDGYLFPGSSENPMPIIKNLEVVNKKWKIYKNLKARREVSFDAFTLPELLDIKRTPAVQREESTVSIRNTVAEAMNTQLAEQQNYLAVCIDEHNSVVRSYGNTQYLLRQSFNLNLTEQLPKPLAVAFSTLKRKVGQTGEPATLSGIKIKHENAVIKVTLTISPLKINKNEQKLQLVTICKDSQQDTTIANHTVFDDKIHQDQYTLNLEEELKELQVKLHSAYERLDASNENMQSFNEELISANEEMQSTNEEMQSVNEELHTINADYQLKNKELLEINDDLNNYFRSNVNGQLFINNELLLMKFSPGTVKQINLLETDIGRPLSNISTNIKFETIIEDIKLVLAEGNVITKEIETNNGKWYQIMTMPYVQLVDEKRNGAIVTFNDITELKATQVELDRKNKSLERINADLDNFVHTASHDLLAPLANIETSIGVMNLIKITDPGLSKFINIINSSVKSSGTLINDISVIARIEGDMLTMEMVDLAEIIANIEWSLENRIKTTGTVITKTLEVQQVLFSKKNLRSILYNLVANGIKFANGSSPQIHIAVIKNTDHILLSVNDNGIGIAKDQVDIIFSMYGRLNKEMEGQGIGLYLAKKIIDEANGTMTVESEPGKGSTFSIFLPMPVAIVD